MRPVNLQLLGNKLELMEKDVEIANLYAERAALLQKVEELDEKAKKAWQEGYFDAVIMIRHFVKQNEGKSEKEISELRDAANLALSGTACFDKFR